MCLQDVQQRSMSLDILAPMLTSNPSLRNESLRARKKVAHVELLRGDARLEPRFAATATNGNRERSVQNKKYFLISQKRAKPRKIFIATTFGKSLFITQHRMRYAISIPLNAKDLTIELTMVAYGNRKNATKFARANNSNLLRALKHIIETRL